MNTTRPQTGSQIPLISIFLTFMALLALLVGMALATGCSSEGTAPTLEETVEADLVAAISPDSPIAEGLKEKIIGLETYGIDLDNFATGWLGTVTHTIEDVALEDGAASVTVSIDCRQLGPAMDRFANDVGEFISEPSTGEMSQTQLHDEITKLFNQAMAGEQSVTLSVVLDYTELDGQWTKASGWDDTILSTLIGSSNILG